MFDWSHDRVTFDVDCDVSTAKLLVLARLDTHDQTTQEPIYEDLRGNIINDRNNNEDRNALIAANQRARKSGT